VEAAFKLVRAKTGKPVILSTRNSFHGKTLGALSATGNENYQSAFGAPVPGFRHIPYGDLEALESYLAEHAGDTAAFIVEPIQGEGGIVEPPQGYLKQVQELCARHGVLTIFDEIQTGLGRTGALFACAEEGVTPDVMVLAKALGGGLIPIGAVLCRAEVYTEDFGLKHSSTFAGNSLGARVGLAVLELLTKDDGALLRSVREKGAKLKAGLERVAAKYPQVVKAIRGRGFMLGIEFVNSRDPYPHSLLGVMAEQELLTPMVASYLLNVERVRVAPTLNGASVIRIEPPLTMGETEIERVVQAVERACGLLASRNTAAFLGHLIGYSRPAALNGAAQPQTVEEARPQPGDGRFAFLVHPVDLDNYSEFDASLADLTAEQLEDLSSRWNDLVEPFVVASTRVVDNCGRSAYGDFICVPKTAAQLLAMDKEQSRREILAAIDLAVERGARLVGLGAYTSVVTMGGRQLLPYTDVALTTGNSYTVVSGVEAAVSAAKEVGLEMATATGAVVGAGGAIGKALAILLSEQVQNLILIGNPARPEKSEYRMLKVAVEIIQHLRTLAGSGRQLAPGSLGAFAAQLDSVPAEDAPLSVWVEFAREVLASGAPLTLTVDSRAHLPRADLILAATSSLEALITPDVLKRGAVVCDMSRPSNVSKEVLEERPDVLVIDGGVIALPGSPDLGWNFGFEKGTAFACMSETMMLALEGRYEHMSIGADLSLEHLELMRGLAKKLGFTLAGFRAFDRPLDPAVWERVRALRKKETA
jgi:acetylornithine/succinyldiaminopimelate/putrescine aminotransferase/predicted amino acid dehydrogenase